MVRCLPSRPHFSDVEGFFMPNSSTEQLQGDSLEASLTVQNLERRAGPLRPQPRRPQLKRDPLGRA